MRNSLFRRGDTPSVAPGFEAQRWVATLFFALAYLMLDRASYLHPMAGYNVTPWNPQPSLAIAYLMVFGWHRLWAVFLTVFVAELTIRDAARLPGSALVVAACLSVGYAAIARLLGGRLHIAVSLHRRSDVLRFLGVVVGGSCCIGAAYVLAIAALRGDLEGIAEAWLRFWIGDAVGIVVFLPLILMMLDEGRRAQVAALLRKPEVGMQVAASLASLWIVFALPGERQFSYFYVLFLPLIWIAARHGMAGTAPAMILLQVGIIIAVEASGFSLLSVFELQALLLALAMTGFFVAVTVDERQRVADDLRRTLKLVAAGEMAAAITHELNQPLTALVNYARACQLLLDGGAAEARAALPPVLDKISSEARRAGDVIRRLRDLFKGGVDGREPIDLGAMVDATVADFRARAPGPNVVVERPATPLLARADPVQIGLVLRNLLQNAVDALGAGSGGTIRVGVQVAAAELRVEVDDTGPGIPAERLHTVFEPFVTDKPSGMGVGLPMSRAIIESHGGTLLAAPGPGGHVYFTLPRFMEDGRDAD